MIFTVTVTSLPMLKTFVTLSPGGTANTPHSQAIEDGVRLSIHSWYVLRLGPTFSDLMVPLATSVDVEHTFSHGRLILSHT
jgi:hypothetical protein